MATATELYNPEKINEELTKEFNYKNVHMVPRLEKIILHRGLGEATSNSKVIEYTYKQWMQMTGQRPVLTIAKKSLSNFKLREGQIIGCKVTLRAKRMEAFYSKLVHIVLPRIRDFRGIRFKGDGRGSFTFGLSEDILFPEIGIESVDKVRGMDITFVTTAQSNEEAFALLKLMGFPFVNK